MSFEKVPTELLYHIFNNYIDSVQDLAQCRLVCKRLDCLAERAMFRKPIIVPNVSTAMALRYHLMKKEELGKLIRSLDFKTVRYDVNDEFIKLLPFVFDPTIELLQGFIQVPIFYKCLIVTAKVSNASFSNLKIIPRISSQYCAEAYYEAILFFRKSLEQIEISFNGAHEIARDISYRLGEFMNLTSLILGGGARDIQDLDRKLSPCKHLQVLTLKFLGFPMQTPMEKDDLLTWMEAHVEKAPTLTKFDFQGYQ